MTEPSLPAALGQAAATLLTDTTIVAVQVRLRAAGLSSVTTWPSGADLTGAPVVGVPLPAGADPLGELRVYLAPGAQLPALLVTQLRASAQLMAALLDANSDLHAARELADHAQSLADHDELTGLGNRRGWIQALRAETVRCRRHPAPAAVLALDLDRLKEANDTGGHAHGDELLRRTAAVLAGQCRASDTACRVGGDEFALLAPETGVGAAEAMATRIRAALVQGGVEVSLGWSVSPGGDEIAAAWAQADGLMYSEKARRKTAPPVRLR